MRFLEELKRWLGEITEIAMLLIAIGIAVQILFGNAVPFFVCTQDIFMGRPRHGAEIWMDISKDTR